MCDEIVARSLKGIAKAQKDYERWFACLQRELFSDWC